MPGPGRRAHPPSQRFQSGQGTQSSDTTQGQGHPTSRTQSRGNQAACANLPTAKLSLSSVNVPQFVVATPGAITTASVQLGGELTARELCSSNPGTISNNGASVTGSGGPSSATLSGGANGSSSLSAKTELEGLVSSSSIDLNSGAPKVSIGSVGSFGSTETSVEPTATGGLKTTYTCTSTDVRVVRNGVEVTGNVSYTLEVIVQPVPRAPWYQRAWNAVRDTAQSFGDWVYDNRTEILVGTAVVALVVVAVAAAPATGGGSLALAGAS